MEIPDQFRRRRRPKSQILSPLSFPGRAICGLITLMREPTVSCSLSEVARHLILSQISLTAPNSSPSNSRKLAVVSPPEIVSGRHLGRKQEFRPLKVFPQLRTSTTANIEASFQRKNKSSISEGRVNGPK